MGHTGDFRYASDLVEFIRREHDGCFHIEVGCYPECHPQSDDAHVDLRHFKRKVDAGANGAITQYFYNADAYFRFVDDARALGIDIPIVPGLMPISTFTPLRRFSETFCAANHRWYCNTMQAHADHANVDLRHFKRKVDAGANGAITQYFYNADAYFRFVDDARALGIDIPIVPGIMPISNFTQLRRFSETCGAEIPRWIGKRMQAYGDDANGVREFGADIVARLCERLIAGGAPSLHFYTLNLAKPTQAVLSRLA